MSNITQARRELIARILEGKGDLPAAQRRAAFDNAGLTGPLANLIEKVAKHAYRVTDEDIGAVLQAGLTENQAYELIVCGAVGQASRQYEAGIAALTAAKERT